MQTYKLNTVQLTLVSLFALLCTPGATAAASKANLPVQAAAAAPDISPKAIPWDQLGAKAGADYQGEGLTVTPTAEGARVHCVFQRLDGEATRHGLWLTSTASGGGKFRVVATVVGREPSSVRSDMDIVTMPPSDQAPSGAAWAEDAAGWWDMPLLTELEMTLWPRPIDMPLLTEPSPPIRRRGNRLPEWALYRWQARWCGSFGRG